MKIYKKGLLSLMILTAMTLMAAEDKTIYVNTFEDEDGENLNKCSLREALVAARKNIAYGGCTAGNTGTGQLDRIQLQAGEYILKRELRPESAVKIYGETPFDYKTKDPLTHQYPARGPISTVINGNHTSRIFNTSETQASIFLENIELKNGYSSAEGGALLIAGPLNMTNTAIKDSKSDKAGGAVYIIAQNLEKQMTLVNTLIQGNQAKIGSAFAMDCSANLLGTQPAISVERSSLVQNGTINDRSTIELCGLTRVSLSANTIARNKANLVDGHIIRAVSELGRPLYSASSLALISNTIVENQANSTFYFDENSTKTLAFNILAFNTGKSCDFVRKDSNSQNKTLGLTLAYNALQLGNVEGQCVLPEELLKIQTTVDLSNISRQSVLSDYQQPSKYNLYLPLYYPKDNQNASDLVNTGATQDCSTLDQRGLARITNGTLTLNPEMKNTCEIGSVERMRLTAADITDLKNLSIVQVLDTYQKEADNLKEGIKEIEDTEEQAIYQKELSELERLIANIKLKQKYRTIYIDPFTLALPSEEEFLNENGKLELRPKELSTDQYSIETHKYGVGSVSGSGADFKFNGQQDEHLFCEWVPELKRIMIYRTDDQLSANTGSAYCAYTIKAKTGESSTGLVKADFINIAPIAKDDTYTLQYGSDLKVSINPLENDSDDGDGPTSQLKLNTNKPAFFHGADGQELPIRFSVIPPGVTVSADRTGPCPGNYIRETCYGGQIHIQAKNNFSQFNYRFEYNIFDAEGEESNTATILLENTAKNTNTAGGGGSFGIWGILSLLALSMYRFRRNV